MKRAPRKEESQFTHPLPEGWLRPYLAGLDGMFHHRWDYWLATLCAGKPLDQPIPRVGFAGQPGDEAARNLTECVRIIQRRGHDSHTAWIELVNWLLWGFGAGRWQPEFPRRLDEDASWGLYTTFNLGLLMQEPADYMAWGSCELGNMAHTNSGQGYFPTPMPICEMMARMTMEGCKPWETVLDPCVGTGSMLLAASNYSLRLYAQDISRDMCAMTVLNGFIFVPWLVVPGEGVIAWPEDAKPAAQREPVKLTKDRQMPLFGEAA